MKKKKQLKAREKTAIVLLALLYLVLFVYGITHNGVLITRESFASAQAEPTELPVFRAPMSTASVAVEPTAMPQELKRGKVNLNQVDQWVLEAIPGVGEAIAQRMIAYRDQHGGFRAIEELRRIQGIGEKLYSVLGEYLEVPEP